MLPRRLGARARCAGAPIEPPHAQPAAGARGQRPQKAAGFPQRAALPRPARLSGPAATGSSVGRPPQKHTAAAAAAHSPTGRGKVLLGEVACDLPFWRRASHAAGRGQTRLRADDQRSQRARGASGAPLSTLIRKSPAQDLIVSPSDRVRGPAAGRSKPRGSQFAVQRPQRPSGEPEGRQRRNGRTPGAPARAVPLRPRPVDVRAARRKRSAATARSFRPAPPAMASPSLYQALDLVDSGSPEPQVRTAGCSGPGARTAQWCSACAVVRLEECAC